MLFGNVNTKVKKTDYYYKIRKKDQVCKNSEGILYKYWFWTIRKRMDLRDF